MKRDDVFEFFRRLAEANPAPTTVQTFPLPALGDLGFGKDLANLVPVTMDPAITDKRPTLFRPPWGDLSPAATKVIHAAGMQSVLWDANSGDTWLKSPQQITYMSLHEASLGGHVLLMHSRPATAAALDTLLTKLQQRGFRFVLPANPQPHAKT